MERRVPLSVVILAKNEAGRLRDCLQSVRWAAEVLVIDDESTDETAAIAEFLGARVLRRRMDNEGRHRNWASTQTTHEWVFSLDADERATPELAEEIRGLFAKGPAHDTYAIPRRNFIGTRWIRFGGWYPSAQLRLFKKSVFRWEEANVHPRAISDRPWAVLRHDVLHFSYQDAADFERKLDRQTTLEAQKWLSDGRTIRFGKALWRTIDRFLRSLILKQGFRDGRWGWYVAWMGGKYQWVSYVKYRRAKRLA